VVNGCLEAGREPPKPIKLLAIFCRPLAPQKNSQASHPKDALGDVVPEDVCWKQRQGIVSRDATADAEIRPAGTSQTNGNNCIDTSREGMVSIAEVIWAAQIVKPFACTSWCTGTSFRCLAWL